jgi:hypothetical protein
MWTEENNLEKTTLEKCEEIIRAILDRCNKQFEENESSDVVIGFAPDWGGPSLTIFDKDLGHTHIGGFHDGARFEDLIDDLHAQLTRGAGLSWATPPDVTP